jgi:hypothetical protein
MTTSGLDTILRYMESWNRLDANGCASCFAEDGVREGRIMARATSPGHRFPRFEGRAAIQERIAGGTPRARIPPTGAGGWPGANGWTSRRSRSTA